MASSAAIDTVNGSAVSVVLKWFELFLSPHLGCMSADVIPALSPLPPSADGAELLPGEDLHAALPVVSRLYYCWFRY